MLQEKEERRVVTMISTHPTTNSSPRNVVNEAASAAVASSGPVVETIIKIGLLKKVSKRWRGVWKVKFLEEVRRGEFYWRLMCVCLCIDMFMNC